MPVARNYKPGSIIYFDGDKHSEEIYILQSGKISLTSLALDTGEEIKESLANGEFFGVKSVLGKYPREETVQTHTQTVVLVLQPDEFEQMVLKNFRILMKMLKVFSNQLRRVGKKVRELMHKGESKMPATELFYIGEYYFKKGKAQQATYVYNKYLEFYQDGQFVDQTKERLDAIGRGDLTYVEETHAPAEAASTAGGRESESTETSTAKEASSTAEEDKGDRRPDVLRTTEGLDITKKYYEGLSLVSQDKFAEAMEIFKTISSQTRFKDEATAKFAEKSYFELGKCLSKLDKQLEAIETFSILLKKFQRTDLLKDTLFQIGESYVKLGKFDKAINFYQKVVNTPPKESINSQAKKALEEAQRHL